MTPIHLLASRATRRAFQTITTSSRTATGRIFSWQPSLSPAALRILHVAIVSWHPCGSQCSQGRRTSPTSTLAYARARAQVNSSYMHSSSYAGLMFCFFLFHHAEPRKACVATKKKSSAVSGPNGEQLIKNLAVASTVLELEEHVIRSLRRAESIHNLYQFFQLTKHHNSWQSIIQF